MQLLAPFCDTKIGSTFTGVKIQKSFGFARTWPTNAGGGITFFSRKAMNIFSA